MSVETRHSTSTAITAAVATVSPRRPGQRLADFFTLCKPRVNSLIVFTAMIGMFLASPAFPPIGLFLTASVGIALVAGAAAVIVAEEIYRHAEQEGEQHQGRSILVGQP